MATMYAVDRYLRVQTDDYNQFFHPNVCHVCKSTDERDLILCDQCRMISYCSEEHKILHRPHHVDICALITIYISEDRLWNTHHLTFDQWNKKQENLVQTTEAVLGRTLKEYEVQMFVFAKTCFICHQRINLHTCERCLSISYCNNHIKHIDHHYTYNCRNLALILNIDIRFLHQTAWSEIYNVKFCTFSSENEHFIDMNSFFRTHFREYESESSFSFTLSDYLSDPLTLHNGLQNVQLFQLIKSMRVCIIHIIAANYTDRRNFPAWELFLHLLSRETKLIITMIGPELELETHKYDVCYHCKEAKKQLIVESYPLLYHNYMFNSNYRRPNIIIGFQAELYRGNTWLESIKAIQRQDCPLLLTGILQYKVDKEVFKIQHILGMSVEPTLQYRNEFRSNKPFRDMESGDVVYRNTYTTIFKNLK